MGLKEIIKVAVAEEMKNSGFTGNKRTECDIVGLNGACEITGYSRHTIYRMTSKHEIPFIKRPGRRKIFFSKKAILDWILFEKN